jgi:hypothetical protein
MPASVAMSIWQELTALGQHPLETIADRLQHDPFEFIPL